MRMATVITASVSVRTSDRRCNVHAARSPATRSAPPMGATRIAWLAQRDGGGLTGSPKMVRCSMPRLRSQFSRSLDRTLMAA